jgi:peptidoglycan/LPS O-acetylase OafA/YrhL
MRSTRVAVGAEPRLGYLPWLDGIRAVAVLAVMVFHELVTQPTMAFGRYVRGGLLGVDIFFAISGFLITSLLLSDVEQHGRIRFGAFYLRRARRLVPALMALLAVLVVGALVFESGHQRVESLRHALVAATYTTNWYTVLTHTRIGLLNHTWSLAAEEQFYLLWPAVLTGLLALVRGRPRRVVGPVAVLAVAAVAWPLIATARGWSAMRVYYGLDTRAAALAVGCLLGALWSTGALPAANRFVGVRRVAAACGAVALVWLLHDPSGVEPAAQFAIVGVATALVLWELVLSSPHVAHRVLGSAPLVAIGRISYALYLWDAVVVLKVHPAGVRGAALVVLHFALVFAAAVLSWFVVERPFRVRRSATVDGHAAG